MIAYKRNLKEIKAILESFLTWKSKNKIYFSCVIAGRVHRFSSVDSRERFVKVILKKIFSLDFVLVLVIF